MRFGRWLLAAACGLFILALAGVIAIVWLVDANRFRPEIERRFTEATGRDLQLIGDIDLKFFPWLALSTGTAELANLPAFTDPVLARWREGRVGVRVLPLIRGELVIDRIRFVGLELNLEKRADGAANWEFGRTSGEGATALPDIAGVELRDATIRYRDTDIEATLEDLDVTVEAVREGAPIVVRDLTFDGEVQDVGFSLRAARLSFDPVAAAVEAPALTITSGGATLEAAASGTLTPAPALSGQFSLRTDDLRGALESAGLKVPPTADPDVLGELEMQGSWVYGTSGAIVDPLTIVLDDTRLTGRLQRGPAADAVVEFDLRGDRIDLARYLEPDDVESEPFTFPLSLLRALPARGVLVLEEAEIGEVVAREITLRAESAGGAPAGSAAAGSAAADGAAADGADSQP